MNSLLEIGKIVKTSGLKGRLKVLSYCESAETLETLENAFIGKDSEHVSSFSVRVTGIKRGSFSIDLEGVESVEAAGELIGRYMFVPSKNLPDGYYYWKDIIGLDIVTEEGLKLGRITTILPTGSSDVYVCSGSEGETFIPAFDDVVKEIDIEKGVMVVKLPEGL
ncbi:MAG: 16S rRNA processing protein RimM [Deltaproteobacteria bacterium]|nr:16S rRNA processing protein RimM [Deltaproteobacteria bacterium]MBW2649368.1 16S rRNA processing protein RimM [Deltaproteobacteria bacterium]